jgi:tRNA dimethylallyltransferase
MKKKDNLPKVFVILGPTASGKSAMAVALAKRVNGEIVSADSRQVYKGLDLGSGKVTKKEMRGIAHHLLDVTSPKKIFTVNDFQRLAYKAIDKILKKDKVPIICGGTGFYIQSVVDGIVLPDVPPNWELRATLEKKTTEDLYTRLKKIDPPRAQIIDRFNKVRLIRAIEIAHVFGKTKKMKLLPKYSAFQVGICFSRKLLKERIEKRLNKRIKNGMIKEVENLHKAGLSWKRMEELGLEYRHISQYLQKMITKSEMLEKLNREIWHYAKKQMTWFKRDKRIWWINVK